jgi:inorganic pyrophosphatase/exopolyphosphatase
MGGCMANTFDCFINNKEEMYKLIEIRNDDFSNYSFSDLKTIRKELIKYQLQQILNACHNKDVFILGHNNPDADSIISSYILHNIFKSMNINAHFCVLSHNYECTFHDEKLLKCHFPYQPEIINPDNKYFVLVDHNNLDGLDRKFVLGAIDHHVIKNEIDRILEIEYASTSLLIYDLFKEKYPFNDEEKFLIGLATLSDTDYLTSSRFTEIDRKLFDELGLDIDIKEYQREFFVTTDFSLGIDKNFEINKKEYKYDNKTITRVQITSYDDINLESYIEKAKSLGYLLIWLNYDKNTTTIYFDNDIIKLNYLLSSTYLVIELLKDRSLNRKLKKGD